MKNKKTKILYGNNKGSALMVAIIIIAILMIFTFSLVLVSYTLYSSQNKKIPARRCAEAANTLSQALDTELTDSEACQNSDLWRYLRFHIFRNDWTFYDPAIDGHNKDNAFKYYEMKVNTKYIKQFNDSLKAEDPSADSKANLDGYPGKVELCIYWMLSEDIYKNMSKDDIAALTPETLTDEQKKDSRLFIEITCETAGQSYTVVNEYSLTMREYLTSDTTDKNEQNKLFKSAKSYSKNPLYNTGSSGEFYTVTEDDQKMKWIWKFESRS